MKLRTRVAISGAATVVAALALVGAIEYPAVGAGMRADVDDQLRASVTGTRADEIKAALTKMFAAKEPVMTQPFGSGFLDVVPDPQVGQFDKLATLTARDVAVANGTTAPFFEDLRINDALYRVYVAPFESNPGALVRVAEPESDRTKTLHQLGWLVVLLIPAAGLVTALGARLLAAGVLSPVARLTSAVEHVTATGDLTTPIAVSGDDEVARLGLAFNAMTAALDGSVGAQRRLVADASHELRTPLTSITTNLELLAERPDDPQAPRLIDEALRQARELTLLTNGLVDLARYGEAPARDEVVPLDQLCADLAERRGVELVELPELETGTRAGPPPGAEGTTRLLSVPDLEQEVGFGPGWWPAPGSGPGPGPRSGPAPMLVRGDPAALERAVANLVDNALKFGTAARISVRRGLGAVVVEVGDDGPGIPAADLPYIFDRFHRSEAARALPGSGLGLAIVKQIVEAHHGSVVAVPQARGALLRITLPAAAAP